MNKRVKTQVKLNPTLKKRPKKQLHLTILSTLNIDLSKTQKSVAVAYAIAQRKEPDT
jgi:hypothetical protein